MFSPVLCLRCNVDVCCAPAGLLTTVPPPAPGGPLLRGRMVKPKEAEPAGDQSDPYVAIPSEPQQESAGKPGNDRPVEETLLPASTPSEHRSAETHGFRFSSESIQTTPSNDMNASEYRKRLAFHLRLTFDAFTVNQIHGLGIELLFEI